MLQINILKGLTVLNNSYYYQIGFELGGDLTKAYVYFLQKLITFNTSSVDLDSINSTYDGGGISFMTSF